MKIVLLAVFSSLIPLRHRFLVELLTLVPPLTTNALMDTVLTRLYVWLTKLKAKAVAKVLYKKFFLIFQMNVEAALLFLLPNMLVNLENAKNNQF